MVSNLANRKKRSTQEHPDASSTVPSMLLDLVAIEEVPIVVWRRAFEVVGYPPGLTARTLSHDAVVDHVLSGQVSTELIELLQVLHDLGTDGGVDAMKAVAEAHQHDLGAITAMAPREAAVQLWLEQRVDPTLREIFMRVQMQAETRREPRAFRDYVGKTARAIVDWKATERRLRALVQEFCTQQEFGDHVDVRGYVSGGDARIQVVHAHRLQKQLVVRDGEAGRGTIAIRPVHCDIVRYDAASGWLRISPRSASAAALEHYRSAIGQAFFGDSAFFSPAEYTLRPLQDRGREALRGALGAVTDARLVEVLWQRGDEQTHWLKAPDCFREIEELELPLREGSFVEAKIALTMLGKRTKRRTVTVKVPNKIDFPRDEHEAVIEAFLKRSGIHAAADVAPHRDLWSLAPWHHEPRVWREAYPRDVDPLVRKQILVPRAMASIAHPDHRSAERVLDIDQSGEFGVSTDDGVPPRRVTGSDIEGLALDVLRMGAAWQASLGLADGDLRDLGGGALLLGRRRLDAIEASIVALTRRPTGDGATLARRVREAVRGDSVALLVPAGSSSGTNLAEIAFASLVLDERSVWREFVRVNSLAEKVTALWSAPPDVRLVIDGPRQLVWIDGLKIDLVADSHPYKLLVLLAEAKGRVVSHDAIGAVLSPSGAADTVSKRAKHDVNRAIKESFAAARRPVDVDQIVCAGSGGYRLAVLAYP